jgi:sodium/hydrogen antiporter
LLVFVVRPAAGAIGLLAFGGATWPERAAISFFGIRGVGSLYYLSYAINEEEFPGKETLWALVAFVIVLSIIVHGIAGAPVMGVLDQHRARANV